MLPRIFLRHKVKFLCSIVFFIYLLNFFGAFTHYYEKDFETTFNYPLEGKLDEQYCKIMIYI
jgi:beta-1,3-galactosyltransferase / beta-1,3-N-acetylglucosaminyltransferase